jgi:xanthine dehydrogenase small subunit
LDNPVHFICNDIKIKTDYSRSSVLLDFLRKEQRLTGTKEGCREGDCGACTVIIGELNGNKVKYKTVNSCLLPLEAVEGKHVVTIEGLNREGLNPIQQAFADEGAVQCGFCTPGFIISLTAYLLSNSVPKLDSALDKLAGNLCRCTGHASIIRAVERIVESYTDDSMPIDIPSLVSRKIIPEYFLSINRRLKSINEYLKKGKKKTKDYVVSGGTDIFVQKQDDIYTSDVELLTADKNEDKIFVINDRCFVSAFTTVTEIMNSEIMSGIIPGLKESLQLFGSEQIRNRATLGGNIVNASPIADLTNIFLALNAKLHIERGTKKREMFLHDFYLGYKTLDKSPEEILMQVSFSLPPSGVFFNYEKVSKRMHLDIASVNSSFYVEVENNIIKTIRISAGGVAPIPLYLKNISEFLTSKEINNENLLQAVKIADEEISPISDVRGSEKYKRLLLRQLIFCHFIKLFPDKIKAEELL